MNTKTEAKVRISNSTEQMIEQDVGVAVRRRVQEWSQDQSSFGKGIYRQTTSVRSVRELASDKQQAKLITSRKMAYNPSW
jgi:hypothetical protein